ncbi:MAG: hypothetical protein RL339_2485 [Pseudomonadota bacterium]|jgi:hypothetical protein
MHLLHRRKPLLTLGMAALLGLGLASCQTATPYQPMIAGQAIHGGYYEQRLGEGHYRVSFDGNTLTSRDRVEGYMLYRAAELTLQNGYDWFHIQGRATEADRRTYVEPFYRPWHGYGYWQPGWRYYRRGLGWRSWSPYDGSPFWADTIDVTTVEEFVAHADIIMRRGRVEPGSGSNFDARKVIADLKPTIELPKSH